MDKKKNADDLKFVREAKPIITEELTDIDSLVSATEYTGMGKIYPNFEGDDLEDVFDIAKKNEQRLKNNKSNPQ